MLTANDVDFGAIATDYGRYRPAMPEAFFDRLQAFDIGLPGQRIVDLGTGTGAMARTLAQRGAHVSGIDRSGELLSIAQQLDIQAGVSVQYRNANAEATGLPANSFDVVTVASAWHWLKQPKATQEVKRLLIAGGSVVICYFDRVALPGNVVAVTEALIGRFHDDYRGSSDGIYPQALADLVQAGFVELESFSFDKNLPYTHVGWRGRIRASSGVGASLTPARVAEFDQALSAMLATKYAKEPMSVPHRVFAIIARKPR